MSQHEPRTVHHLGTPAGQELITVPQPSPADVRVLSGEAGVVEHLAVMAQDNHQFARFNQIRIDETGRPDAEDLHLAWAAGSRIAVLTPR